MVDLPKMPPIYPQLGESEFQPAKEGTLKKMLSGKLLSSVGSGPQNGLDEPHVNYRGGGGTNL